LQRSGFGYDRLGGSCGWRRGAVDCLSVFTLAVAVCRHSE
jgi:hypothetical protein